MHRGRKGLQLVHSKFLFLCADFVTDVNYFLGNKVYMSSIVAVVLRRFLHTTD